MTDPIAPLPAPSVASPVDLEAIKRRLDDDCVLSLLDSAALIREVESLRSEVSRLQGDDSALSEQLKYAREVIRKGHNCGAAFVGINISTLSYLCENRRALNDRVRWAEQRQAAAEAEVENCEELAIALGESVRLQSHYATLLNEWDGGRRIAFADSGSWMKRLRELGKFPASPSPVTATPAEKEPA